MTYEERYEAQFLARSWAAVRAILASALALLGVVAAADAAYIPARVVLALRRLLRPAEALLRRILVVEALRIDPPPLRTRAEQASSAGPRSRSRAPGFRLIEPYPSTTPYSQRRPIARPGPRIHCFTDAGLCAPSPVPETTPEMLAGQRDLARLRALASIIASPEKTIHRLSRWFARRRLGRRRSPLRIGRAPPTSHCDLRSELREAQHFARAAIDRRRWPP